MTINLAEEEKKIQEELNQLAQVADEPQEEIHEEPTETFEEEVEEDLQEEIEDSLEEEEGESSEVEEDLDPKKSKSWKRMRERLKEERDERMALERQMQEMRERQARIEGAQQAALTQRQEPKPEELDLEPDRDIDPDEWRDWKIRQQDKVIRDLAGRADQQGEVMRAQQEQRGLEVLENRYAEANPDYQDKMNYLKKLEAVKMRVMNPNVTDEQVEAHIMQQKMAIGKEVFEKHGRNPAEVFAELAVQQGYVPSNAKVTKKSINVSNIKKNMKKNASVIGGTSAEPVGDELTPNDLLNMSIDQMAALDPKRITAVLDKTAR